MNNNSRFTRSENALRNIELAEAESNNTGDFLTSDGYVTLTPEGEVRSRRLYEAYVEWCRDNAPEGMTRRQFIRSMNDLAPLVGMTYTNHIAIGAGRLARSFTGIALQRE